MAQTHRVNVPATVADAFSLAAQKGVKVLEVNRRGRGFVHVLEVTVAAARRLLELLNERGATNRAPYKAVKAARARLADAAA